MSRIRTYREMVKMDSFLERFNYLELRGEVGATTFGSDRYLNQRFYMSKEWRKIRHTIIARDQACDLGIADREIHGRIIIHHMNPISVSDLEDRYEDIINPGYLITTTHETHNAIHYGSEKLLPSLPPERLPGDTRLW